MGSSTPANRQPRWPINNENRSPQKQGRLLTGSRANQKRSWLLFLRIKYSSPAPRTAFQHVPVVQQAVEHGAHGCRVAQQFAPVFHRAVGGQHGAGTFVAAHDDFEQFLGGGERQRLLRCSDGSFRHFLQLRRTLSSRMFQNRRQRSLLLVSNLEIWKSACIASEGIPDGPSESEISAQWIHPFAGTLAEAFLTSN